jgi:hypothetical protein
VEAGGGGQGAAGGGQALFGQCFEQHGAAFWTLRADTWRCCSHGGRAHCGSSKGVCITHICVSQVLEWGTITAYRGGWLSIWNGLDVATYILQVCL